MRRFIAQRSFQRFDGRQSCALFRNKSPKAAAKALVAQRCCEQRQMNVAAGLVPGPERACGNVLLHAFFGAAKEGQFPVVDGAGAVGRQMGEPAAFSQQVDDAQRAVLNQRRAVHQNHAGISLSRRSDLPGAFADCRLGSRFASRRGTVGVNEDFFKQAQAVPLRQRVGFDFSQVKWQWIVSHFGLPSLPQDEWAVVSKSSTAWLICGRGAKLEWKWNNPLKEAAENICSSVKWVSSKRSMMRPVEQRSRIATGCRAHFQVCGLMKFSRAVDLADRLESRPESQSGKPALHGWVGGPTVAAGGRRP